MRNMQNMLLICGVESWGELANPDSPGKLAIKQMVVVVVVVFL